jgi:hypothetical protein
VAEAVAEAVFAAWNAGAHAAPPALDALALARVRNYVPVGNVSARLSAPAREWPRVRRVRSAQPQVLRTSHYGLHGIA